jgi:dolichol-phosphate mannosyltransferase
MQQHPAAIRSSGFPAIHEESRNQTSISTSTMELAHYELSIVVPTKNEAGNIAILVQQLEQALLGVAFEIIFVDDSDDETAAVIERVSAHSRCHIALIHRPPDQRNDRLGGAVVAGLHIAQASYACVMAADLQHPPAIVPELLSVARQKDLDLVIASRYCDRSDARGIAQNHTVISYAATTAAQLLFPSRLHGLTDPMSGFFLLRKEAIDLDELRPQGSKLLIEILVRAPDLRITEVGFEFGKRHTGQSKASFREGMRSISHLGQLRLGEGILRFIRFLVVGLSGLLVNSLVLAFGTELLGFHYLVSTVLATQGSTLWNFVLTEFWVFSGERQPSGRLARLMLFFLMNNAALLVRGPMIYVLTSILGIHYIISNLLSLATLTIVRYMVANKWIWGRVGSQRRTATWHHYDIHGILTVASEVGLPELEQFRVETLADVPNICVRTGKVRPARGQRPARSDQGIRRIYYDDGLASLGFAINVTLGKTIDILASPILRWSPHVLYTNVVEPILRWTFVEKGYALVHGACISFGEHAYMVTARTDTGKTTTILRLLDRQRRATDTGAFLSDDLTLVRPDGRVLTYPKPLTISAHTVAAINMPRLSRAERLALPLQSRLHSRDGRRFALWLSKSKLPVATINTIVQLLVPPPKYHVQQLVPHAQINREARLAGLIVIERGSDGDQSLSEQEGLEILLRNCDDAYGFPPYEAINTFLHNTNTLDLRAVERGIIAHALKGLPATLLRSTKLDWSYRIPALVNLPSVHEDWTGPASFTRDIAAFDQAAEVVPPNTTVAITGDASFTGPDSGLLSTKRSRS